MESNLIEELKKVGCTEEEAFAMNQWAMRAVKHIKSPHPGVHEITRAIELGQRDYSKFLQDMVLQQSERSKLGMQVILEATHAAINAEASTP